ncbi:MAG: metallophosphoesterase [Oscillospiraceae bacterium]|nr:metallophosphoesterase [Oscillospiraceae bacterium]
MNKRNISILLLIVILLSLLAGCVSPAGTANSTAATDDYIDDGVFRPKFRMVVCSDIHITDEANIRTERLKNMLSQMNDYASSNPDDYGRIDALCIVGDIGHDGTVAEWELAKKVLDEGMSEETQLVITTGNHDYYNFAQASKTEFEKIFGADAAQQHIQIGGYDFITVNFDENGTNCSDSVVQWVNEEVKKATETSGSNKPVFVFQHIGNEDTVLGTCSHFQSGNNKNLKPIYAQYPNVVNFSGHTHYLQNDDCSIHQKDFTSIGTGTLNYTMRQYNGPEEIPIENKTEVSQVWVIELDGRHKMRLKVWDVLQEKFLGEDRYIESYEKENFVYTEDRFTSDQLFFPEGAVPEVTNVTNDSVSLEFPRTAPESLNGRVYRVDIWTADGSVVDGQLIGINYFDGKYDEKVSVEFTGLEPNTEYKAKVFAINGLYCVNIADFSKTFYSTPIEVTFKTK